MAYTTIDDPSEYFQTALYTGNGGTLTVTNDGNSDLQPDWIWGSLRDEDGGARFVFDSTRGTTKRLKTNANTEEQVRSGVTAFNSDGFTVGSHSDSNLNAKSLVAWQWKANGGTTSSNSSGSITSTVQANTTAGFSIVTYTGTGSNGNIGHGLGVAPSWVLCKDRDGTGAWVTWINTLAGNQALELQSTNAVADEPTSWNSTVPSSTVFSVGTRGGTNASSRNFVAYCFAEKQGYSKFGSYTGNGNADGPFVYTGFKPAWLLVKNTTDSGDDWHMYDNTRDTFNVADARLKANTNDAEATDAAFDFLSNGFKVRSTSNARNGNGDAIIFMCFASSPFVSSEGVPTTAR